MFSYTQANCEPTWTYRPYLATEYWEQYYEDERKQKQVDMEFARPKRWYSNWIRRETDFDRG
jgi:hypothetical protein